MTSPRPPTRRHLLAAGVALIATFALPPGALAQQAVLRIAAVVNEEIVSAFDVESRLLLTLLQSGLRPTQQTMQRLAPDILRQLIDEKLRLQEASANGINVSEADIAREFRVLEERNNLPEGGLLTLLRQRNIDPRTLETQIRANIAWQRLIQRRLRRDARVGEDEIDEELALLRQNLDKPQQRVFEIFLPVDSFERDEAVRRNAEQLVRQIRDGAAFSEVARSFSQSGTASVGGDLGWQPAGALPFEVEEALSAMRPGQVSDPIATMTGYYIVRLAERRQIDAVDPGLARLDLVQLSARPGRDAALGAIAEGAVGCEALQAAGEAAEGVDVARVSDVLARDLPDAVAQAMSGLDAGDISPVLALPDRAVVLGVCARQDPPSPLPSREEIRERLERERLELLARRYLRDLRQAAFIDVRM